MNMELRIDGLMSNDGSAQNRLRILVVEDDDINQFVFLKILTHAGNEVVCASDGKQALETLQNETVDVVVMDIKLPVIDGVQVAQAIRSGVVGEDKKDIPIIAVTAYVMPGDREKILAAGINGYLAKPFGQNDLIQALALAPRDD